MPLPENTEQAKREVYVSPDSAPRCCSLACLEASMEGGHLLLEEGRGETIVTKAGEGSHMKTIGKKGDP